MITWIRNFWRFLDIALCEISRQSLLFLEVDGWWLSLVEIGGNKTVDELFDFLLFITIARPKQIYREKENDKWRFLVY